MSYHVGEHVKAAFDCFNRYLGGAALLTFFERSSLRECNFQFSSFQRRVYTYPIKKSDQIIGNKTDV